MTAMKQLLTSSERKKIFILVLILIGFKLFGFFYNIGNCWNKLNLSKATLMDDSLYLVFSANLWHGSAQRCFV
jgi:hypothetical protein